MRNLSPTLTIANNSCRLCLCTESDVNIFDRLQLHLKIMKCFRIKVEVNDGLPDSICNRCFDNVEYIWKFKECCEKSDFVLRNRLQKQYRPDVTFPLHDSPMATRKSPAKICEKIETLKHKIHSENVTGESINNNVDIPIPTMQVKMKNDGNVKAMTTKFHQCDKCGKHFTRSSHLVIHMRIHTGEKPFKCSKCEKSFSLHHVKKSHERTHTKLKPYHCLSCSRCFTDSSSLTRHKKIHCDDKKYVCGFCPKRFITAYDLRRHKASHTGERMYACQHCSKTFIYESHLSKHKKTHIETTQKTV